MGVVHSKKIGEYFTELDNQLKKAYDIAGQARKKGYDPSDKVEIEVATNLGERVEGLVGVVVPQIKGSGVVARLIELENQYGLLDWRVGLTIGLEVSQEKFCTFKDKLEAMESGVRVGLAYMTLGVVSSPLEGFVKIKIRKRRDGAEYIAAYYSGPIRSAGGTMAAVSVLIADYIRKNMGYSSYDPSEEEVKRTVTELYDYHDRITNLQYLPSEQEIDFLARNLPVQVDGDPSEDLEVSNYKDVGRIETNRIRNGICLVIGEGIAQKAVKVAKQIDSWGKQFGLEHWGFMQDFVKLQKKIKAKGVVESSSVKIAPDNTFIKDVVAGRPVLTYPLRTGGFRLRYGRSRTSGFSSMSMHPATMVVLDDYIATGTQLKYERPGKSSAMAPCDSIEGPIVRLNNGDVVLLNTVEEAVKHKHKIREILFMGDYLVNYAEFYHRGHRLIPAGYCEEWYAQELKKEVKEDDDTVQWILKKPSKNIPSGKEAVRISLQFKVPLHPRYTHHYIGINKDEFITFAEWLSTGSYEDDKIFIKNNNSEAKRTLELLGVSHRVVDEKDIVIDEDFATGLAASFGFYGGKLELDIANIRKVVEESDNVLVAMNQISQVIVRDKSGTFIGARMGRPEKAKIRKLTGNPQALFPVGDEGGKMRSLNVALDRGKVSAEYAVYKCRNCEKETIFSVCEVCDKPSEKLEGSRKMQIDINHYFRQTVKKLGLDRLPEMVKGVKGTMNEDHIPEHLAKGILRAMHGIYVNKDGTIRYDMTEMPITHFKPREVGTSVEKLRKLGYDLDCYGAELVDGDQVLEIKPQDVILPRGTKSGEEGADETLFRTANFVDDLLVRLYGLEKFYNLKTKEDLVGQVVIGIAPHISAAIVGRIIGFSEVRGCYAHPMWHAAQRRDCDGDENCVILLMDALLNFSKKFFAAHRGATQDAPLLIISQLIPTEVDDMVFAIDICWEYPLELYTASLEYKDAKEVKIEQIMHRLGKEGQYEGMGFTNDVTDINMGVNISAYKSIPTMKEKVLGQMLLAEKIRAVDESDVARLIIERHFIRDIRGNLRKFTTQQFRCVSCNEKYRRPPMVGRCLKCSGNIVFTVAEGSVLKYLEPSLSLAEKYHLPSYLRENLELTKRKIESVFGRETDKQSSLEKWFG